MLGRIVLTLALVTTAVSIEVNGIRQRHLERGGWSASAVLALTRGGVRTELPIGMSGANPRVRVASNGLRITVYVIHHTGGMELRVEG